MSRIFLLTLVLTSVSASAQAPRLIPYQGVLEDGGTPVTSATSVTFSLFDAATGGTAAWTETQSVTPDAEGVFAVQFGSVTDLDDLSFGEPLWLMVSVDGTAMGPRTALGAVPYALGLYGLTVLPNNSDLFVPIPGPNLVGGSAANSVASNIGGATISGGGGLEVANTVTGNFGTVGGGRSNAASSSSSTVGGGASNTASSSSSTVGGGASNTASGGASTVGGGASNTASGFRSTVPGGYLNHARGLASFAAGFNARAIHDGTFVWADRSFDLFDDSLFTTGENQFLIRAAGGVGIGTNAPLSDVHVEGSDLAMSGAATQGDAVLVEGEDAVVGLYSSPGGSRGSALSFGEISGGALTSKWGIVRGTGTSGALYFTFGSGPGSADQGSNNALMRIDANGTVRADGAFIGGGADLAEYFPLAPSASVAPGQVVGLRGGQVSLTTEGAEQIAVISSDPAFVGNPDAESGGALVALVGQVEVRLVGSASPGDLLIASGAADGTAQALVPSSYDPAFDGPVIGRVLRLTEVGTAVALVGVDEAAALRGVVSQLLSDRDRQQAELDALRAEVQAIREALAPHAVR